MRWLHKMHKKLQDNENSEKPAQALFPGHLENFSCSGQKKSDDGRNVKTCFLFKHPHGT